jgi:hypothetical protein
VKSHASHFHLTVKFSPDSQVDGAFQRVQV